MSKLNIFSKFKALQHLLFQSSKYYKIFLFWLVFILVPIAITFYLFPLKTRIEIPVNNKKTIYISDSEIVKPSLKTIVADAIQAPLNLRWYDVYIVNKSYFTKFANNHIPGKDSPILRVTFIQGNPNKYQNSNLQTAFPELKNPNPLNNAFQLGKNQVARFTYSGTDGFNIGLFLTWDGQYSPLSLNPSGGQMDDVELKYEVLAYPNIQAWIAKLIFISIFWCFLLSSLLGLFEFSKKLKNIPK